MLHRGLHSHRCTNIIIFENWLDLGLVMSVVILRLLRGGVGRLVAIISIVNRLLILVVVLRSVGVGFDLRTDLKARRILGVGLVEILS